MRAISPRFFTISAAAIISACSYNSFGTNEIVNIEGRWNCERSHNGEFDIKKENGIYKIYQVSEDSNVSTPGEIIASLAYDKNKKKYIGQHIWGGKKMGPISWGKENGMEITVVNKDQIFKVYLDSIYTGGWTCNRVKF